MRRTLRLRDEVYQALKEAARDSGLALEEWIASHLPAVAARNGGTPTAKEIARANARMRRHIISSGQPGPCDNEQIDADLAREYEDDHRKLYHRDKR